MVQHEINVGDAKPIKQHPYSMNPKRAQLMKAEIDYMLENRIIERSCSAWASPGVLVDKPDRTVRFCTDYQEVNQVTTDTYPIPRMDDCIDRIRNAPL